MLCFGRFMNRLDVSGIMVKFIREVAVGIALFAASNVASANCVAIDFMSLQLGTDIVPPQHAAIALAYSQTSFSADGNSFRIGDSSLMEFGRIRPLSDAKRLNDASVAEQFLDAYPLTYDLESRQTPYFDPGRIRNKEFFDAIYGDSRHAVEKDLVSVTGERFPARFQVTRKQNVNCQLQAVIGHLEMAVEDYTDVFSDIGGGFNWRTISGTSRLSAHAYGIAVDVNPEVGQYWKWTGVGEGKVGRYGNLVPQEVVETFERFGFIWGGKWHHFDGMHFEYRPEMIIHARLIANTIR